MMNLPDVLLQYRFHANQISSIQRQNQLSGMAEVAAQSLRSAGRFRSMFDLQCHRRTLSYDFIETIEELAAIGEWLLWLRESFDDAGDRVVDKYLRVWRGLCSRQKHLGRGVWNIYKRFKPSGENLNADLLVLLAAYGGISQDDVRVVAIRSFFGR